MNLDINRVFVVAIFHVGCGVILYCKYRGRIKYDIFCPNCNLSRAQLFTKTAPNPQHPKTAPRNAHVDGPVSCLNPLRPGPASAQVICSCELDLLFLIV